jgi:hypothetical protein
MAGPFIQRKYAEKFCTVYRHLYEMNGCIPVIHETDNGEFVVYSVKI